MKCECPYNEFISKDRLNLYSKEELKEVNHKANNCNCKNNLKYYIRRGKKICLCSKCVMFGDKEIKY